MAPSKSKKKAVKQEEPLTVEPEKAETPKNRDKVLVISILVLVICFGAIFYFLKNTPNVPDPIAPETRTYKGFIFEKYGNVWLSSFRYTDQSTGKSKKVNVMFHYTPDEVENITTERNTRNETVTPLIFMNVPRIYITTEPDYPSTVILGGVEIAKILAQVYGKEVKSGLTKASNNTQTSIITCEDLNATQRVIYLKLGNETAIKSENGCIVIEGKTPIDVVKASERLTYELLKIL